MKLVVRRPVWMACAALLAIGVVVVTADWGIGWWDRFQTEQEQLLIRRSRLQGWVAVASTVASAHDALIGTGGARRESVLSDLSQQATTAGIRLTELKPRTQDVELSLEGSVQGVGAYLQGLTTRKPPLQVEGIGLASQPKAGAPLLLRLRVRYPDVEVSSS